MGALDFAGGTVVHVNAAVAALVAVIVIGKRQDYPSSSLIPHSVPLVLLGAGVLWFGWFGFNAGSALAASPIAGLAFVTTMLAPAATLTVWTILDFVRLGKATAVGAATAIVVGLVAVTPAAGFISPMNALLLGAIAAVPSYFALIIRAKTSFDDSLDVVAAHGVGGTVGALLTGIFAEKALNGLADGVLYGNPGQLGIQAAAMGAAIVYSGVGDLHPAEGDRTRDAAAGVERRREAPASTSRCTARKPTCTPRAAPRGTKATRQYLLDSASRGTSRAGRRMSGARPLRFFGLDFKPMTTPSFGGLRVLALESRREREMAALITTHGGEARVAPSMREVPLESNTAAAAFADALVRGEFDVVVLLTGVGTRVLLDVVERTQGSRDAFVAALGRVRVAVRGPKPLAVLRELGLTPWVAAAEPNTWRELVAAIDAGGADAALGGRRVAVQEYGTSNADLLAALEARGAQVTAVPVYQWALPEDLGPLEDACRALATKQVDVALFTTATQVVHLLQVAERMGAADSVRAALGQVVIASIGPTTSDELRAHGIDVDMEPSHPKMGLLVREAAMQAASLRAAKHAARS